MAFEKKTPTRQTTGNQKPKAAAFLNLQVRDAEGNLHSLRAGVPLHVDNQLENSLINAANTYGAEFTVECVGMIKVITPEEDKPEVAFAAPGKAKATKK